MLKALFATSDSDSESDSEVSLGDNGDNGILAENPVSTSGDASTITDEYLSYTSSSGQIDIKLKQQKQLGIAHQLWPAASFLCDYLEANLSRLYPLQTSFNVLELGAGIGLCGLFMSKLSTVEKVVLTDLECVQQLLRDNIHLNIDENRSSEGKGSSGLDKQELISKESESTAQALSSTASSSQQDADSVKVQSEVLCWGVAEDVTRTLRQFPTLEPLIQSSTGQLPLLVIASDCVYWEHLFQPLYETLLHLTRHGCHVIISHVRRWKRDSKFFQMCTKTMLVEKLHEELDYVIEEFDGSRRRRVQRIYRIQAIPSNK